MPRPLSEAEVERLRALQREQGLFERLIGEVAALVLLPGEGAIDGGAHQGLHLPRLAGLVGSRGWLLAVEPLPGFAARLRLLQAATPQLAPCRVIEAALSDRAGRAPFQHVTNSPAHSGLRLRHLDFVPDLAAIEVACQTLDELLAGRERLAFVKLDLEGGEFRALQGGAGSLARHRPVVIFEDSRQHAAQLYGYSAEDYFGFFGRLGYRLLDLFGRPFGPADWTPPRVPYYRIALPRGGGAEARVIQALPGIVRAHLSPAAAC